METNPTHRCKHICNSHKPTHRPKIAKELSPLPPEKNYFLKSPSLLKILKTPTHNPTEKHSDSWLQNSILTRIASHGRQERQGITAPIRNWRFSG